MSLPTPAIAAFVVVVSWWLSTGVVLGLVWQPAHRHRAILGVAGVAALAAAGALIAIREDTTPTAAYVGFASSLMIWAWHELAFLLGVVTGPNRSPCPPSLSGWKRFGAATATLIHHEVALAATLVVLAAATWDAPNQVGLGTFAVLWVMRLSSKLNLFLGVHNVTEEFVPMKLRYLVTYFGPKRLSPLMPISLLVSSSALAGLVASACWSPPSPYVEVASSMLATLLGLAVLEHVFLCVPLSEATLWRWAIPRRDRMAPVAISGDK
jgi:putative photosynthetic complex assembly protein 2